MRQVKNRMNEGQEFHSKNNYWGWLDRNFRGQVTLELSFVSRLRLARENNERIIAEWRSYLV